MPAVSKAQFKAMEIAKHEPGKLFAKNKGLANMSKAQLDDFTEGTYKKSLPNKVGSLRAHGRKKKSN